MPKAALLTRRANRRWVSLGTALALIGGLSASVLGRIDSAGAVGSATFDGSVTGSVASPAVVAPAPFTLAASGTVVSGGAWMFWSAAAAQSTLVLDGPDTDTDGAGADTDVDLFSFASDAELSIGGGRKVFSAPIPTGFLTGVAYTSDLAAADQLAAVAVVNDGGARTFFHIERDLSAVDATPVSATFTGLPKPVGLTGQALYGSIEAAGAPTAGSSSFASPDSGAAQTFTAGTVGVEAEEVPVNLTAGATTAKVVLSGDADQSFTRLYSGVAYPAPAPSLTATARFVNTGLSTDVTSRNPGQSFDVLVSLANAGGAGPLQNAAVSIPIPSRTTQSGTITEEDTTAAGSFSGAGPVAISVTELLGGETYTVRIPVTVTAGAGAGASDEVQLAAQTVTYDDPSGSTGLTTTTSADALDVNATADLGVTMTAGTDQVLVGGEAIVTYNVTISNAGPDPATAGSFSIPKPAGSTATFISPDGLSCNATVVCTLDQDLASGASIAFAATFRVTTAGAKTSSVTRTSSTPTDPNAANNATGTVTVTVSSPTSAVTLTGNAPASVTLDDPTTDPYTATFTATNTGPDQAEGATLSVPVPSGTIVTVKSGCTGVANDTPFAVGTITCTFGSIPLNGVRTVTLSVDALTSGTKTLTGTYSQSSAGAAPAPVPLVTEVRPQIADLGFDATQAATAMYQTDSAGTPTSATVPVKVRNFGPQFTSIAPKVELTLVPGITQGSPGDLSAAGCTFASGKITCTLPDIGNGATQTVNIPVVIDLASGASAGIPLAIKAGLTPEELPSGEGAQPNSGSISVALNRRPAVVADAVPFVLAPGAATVNVLVNDVAVSGNVETGETFTLSGVSVSPPEAGSNAVINGGTITFTPAADFLGDVTITYTVSDGRGGSQATSVGMKVRKFNALVSGGPLGANEVLAHVTDTNTAGTFDVKESGTPSGGTATDLTNGVTGLTLRPDSLTEPTIARDATHATAVIDAGKVKYTPIKGFTSDPLQAATQVFELDTLKYTLENLTTGISVTGTLRVRTRNANPDGCTVPLLAETPTDKKVTITVVGRTVTDLNTDGPTSTTGDKDGVIIADLLDPTTPACLAAPAAAASVQAAAAAGQEVATSQGGKIVLQPDLKSVEYTPKAQFRGEDTFVVQIVDPRGGASLMKGTVKVLNADPQPFGPPVTVVVNKPQIVLDITDSSDPNNDKLGFTAADQTSAKGGMVQVIENGTKLRYSPPKDYVGPDSFRYTVSDGTSSVSATLEIFVVADPNAKVSGGSTTAGTSGTLPATGANSTSRGFLGFGAFGVGLLLLGLGERRRRAFGPRHLR